MQRKAKRKEMFVCEKMIIRRMRGKRGKKAVIEE